MNKKLLIGSFLLGVLIISCQKNVVDKLPSQNISLKEKVIAFMDNKKARVGDSAKIIIEKLKGDINWSDFTVSESPGGYKQKRTAFRIKKDNSVYGRVSNNTYTCLYVIQNSIGNVINVSTLEIDIPNSNSGSLNSLALNLVNNNMQGYTGSVVRRNLSGYYIYEIDINNGSPSAFKYMKKRNTGGRGNQTGRTAECVDWYWQTYINGVLVSEVFLFTDCSQGVEEGGGGGGGGGGNPPDTTNTPNPCNFAQLLEGDSALNSQLGFLNTLTGLNYENGYVIGRDNVGNIVYDPVQGSATQHYLPSMSFSSPVQGIMHTHFAGGFSIFSPADLQSLYQTYSTGMASPGFTYAVTTQTGTYALQVTNLSAFLTYGQAHLQDSAAFDIFQLDTYINYSIWELGTAANNEAGFLQMLQSENMGLTLLSKSDPNTNDWEVKTFVNGIPITLLCL